MSITLDAVREAAKCIEPYAHRTPVMTCAALDERAGRRVFFKCENFQKIGAFKFRGACNAVMKLADDVAARGVVTHSSGNHAQALALAARLRGIEAHIVMPSTASPVKRAAVEAYGGKVYACEPNETARRQRADELVAETGGTLISPFDHPHVIAGQGTATLELLDEVGGLDAIIAPIGGGGLMSGTCIAGRGMKPGVRLFGTEPTGADDAARSDQVVELELGHPAVVDREPVKLAVGRFTVGDQLGLVDAQDRGGQRRSTRNHQHAGKSQSQNADRVGTHRPSPLAAGFGAGEVLPTAYHTVSPEPG